MDGLGELAEANDDVTIGDALDQFGNRSFAPFLVLVPLLEISPIGGIPGVPTALAILVALIAVQLLIGREHIWLPGFVERRSVSADKLESAIGKLEKIAQGADAWFGGRLKWLTKGPAITFAALMVLALCAAVPPLEVVPFASSVPMLAIAAFGLALMVRDGLLMLVAGALSIGSIAIVLITLGGSGGG